MNARNIRARKGSVCSRSGPSEQVAIQMISSAVPVKANQANRPNIATIYPFKAGMFKRSNA